MFWDISQKHISNIVQFCVYQICYKFLGKIYSIFCRQQNVFFMCTSSYVRLRFKQLEFNLFLCSLLDFITPWRKLTYCNGGGDSNYWRYFCKTCTCSTDAFPTMRHPCVSKCKQIFKCFSMANYEVEIFRYIELMEYIKLL